jgi:hypothetical protein
MDPDESKRESEESKQSSRERRKVVKGEGRKSSVEGSSEKSRKKMTQGVRSAGIGGGELRSEKVQGRVIPKEGSRSGSKVKY